MAKNLDPKCKQCRREGEKLFIKGEKCNTSKCPIVKRNYPPGAHGQDRRSRPTEYGQQLREKQKAKRIYGLLEKPFRSYYKKAMKKQGDTGEILKQMLELRFDNVIYRLGWAASRRAARQAITHNFFFVNGKRVNVPSCQLKVKDEITVKPVKTGKKNITELKLEKHEVPSWMASSPKEMKAKILNIPKTDEMDQTFSPRLIVEFYSR